MDSIFAAIGLLGVLQGLLLAGVFMLQDTEGDANRWLAILFGLLSVVTVTIVLVNTGTVEAVAALETLEYAATLLAGPLLFIVSRKLLGRDLPSPPVLSVHFLPFVLYFILSAAGGLEFSVLVPVLHMQGYTLWLVFILARSGNRSASLVHGSPEMWLRLLALFLVAIHVAQWIRFTLPEEEHMELLIPLVAGSGFYLLTFYGLATSSVFSLVRKYSGKTIPENELENHIRKLEQVVRDEKAYRDPDLSLETLAEMVGIHPNLLSRVINTGYGMGFNEFINTRRVETAKKLLADPGNEYFTIEALGKEAGFNSRSSFYAAFKKNTGTTPSAFKAADTV